MIKIQTIEGGQKDVLPKEYQHKKSTCLPDQISVTVSLIITQLQLYFITCTSNLY